MAGSGGAAGARRLCLGFLQQRLGQMTRLDQEVLEALRVYDCSLLREPQWGEDFFGIDPFYIALGFHLQPTLFPTERTCTDMSSVGGAEGRLLPL